MSILTGNKWGVSQSTGTPGGVVTWSLPGAGHGISAFNSIFNVGGTSSVDGSSFMNFNFETLIRSAFDAWSAAANIEFIQVEDPGGAAGSTNFADIRIFFGFGDGFGGNYDGLGFFPFPGSAIAGDILMDTTPAFNSDNNYFFNLMLHEIGHAIGLDHETRFPSIMNPVINVNGLQTDDISGISSVYGNQDSLPSTYEFASGQSDVNITTSLEGLSIIGNSLDNNISGAQAAERFTGGTGNDTIDAGAGNDTVIAGLSDGDDTLTGGAGFDILDFSAVQGVVQINQLGGVITGSAGNDTLNDVFEQIIGSNFNDALSGGNGGDVLDGNDGNDQFFANGGDDLVRGGEGNDTVFHSTNDGNDRLMGGNGFDVLDYSSLQGVVQVNQLAGTTTGTANNDILLDVFEAVIGTNFGDVLSGGQGINVLNGGGGDDQLFANGGNDQTSGGAGNDTITLGLGDDRHDYRNGEDVDTITDFNAGAGSEDAIILTFHSAATSFAQMQMAGMFSQQGANTQIDLGGGDMIILNNINVGDLHQDDFVF